MDYLETLSSLPPTSLALISSLIAANHFLLQCPSAYIHLATQELQDTAANTLGLTSVAITCTPSTTLAEFTEAILSTNNDTDPHRHPNHAHETPQIPNIILALNLPSAPRDIQILTLELMHTSRLTTTKSGIHLAPKHFCFVAVCTPEHEHGSASGNGDGGSGWPEFKTKHLRDRFWMGHLYDPPFPSPSASPASSIKQHPHTTPPTHRTPPPATLPPLPPSTLSHLTTLIPAINSTAELRRYSHDLITHLRMHPHVSSGISAIAPRYMMQMAKVLAVMNGVGFVTPGFVGVAVGKVVVFRVGVVGWGMGMREGEEMGEGGRRKMKTAEEVVEEVLAGVPCPL